MARIAGVNIPDNKHAVISLTYIFGVGRTQAKRLCAETNIPESTKIGELSEAELDQLRGLVSDMNVEVLKTVFSGRFSRAFSSHLRSKGS